MFTVYQITNTLTKDSYIGVTGKFKEIRWKRHQYLARYGSGGRFHCAIREYGAHLFVVEALEEGWDPEIGRKIREPYWISVLKPEYNETSGGNGTAGHVISDVTREKMRKPKSPEHRKNISISKLGNQYNVGSKRTEESKRNISISLMGHSTSEETRRKMSIKKIGNRNATGSIRSEEFRRKLSVRMRGTRYAAGFRSEQFRKHMSEIQKGKKRSSYKKKLVV